MASYDKFRIDSDGDLELKNTDLPHRETGFILKKDLSELYRVLAAKLGVLTQAVNQAAGSFVYIADSFTLRWQPAGISNAIALYTASPYAIADFTGARDLARWLADNQPKPTAADLIGWQNQPAANVYAQIKAWAEAKRNPSPIVNSTAGAQFFFVIRGGRLVAIDRNDWQYNMFGINGGLINPAYAKTLAQWYVDNQPSIAVEDVRAITHAGTHNQVFAAADNYKTRYVAAAVATGNADARGKIPAKPQHVVMPPAKTKTGKKVATITFDPNVMRDAAVVYATLATLQSRQFTIADEEA